MGIIERIIREPEPANHQNIGRISEDMAEEIRRFLHRYLPMDGEVLAQLRYERFRRM